MQPNQSIKWETSVPNAERTPDSAPGCASPPPHSSSHMCHNVHSLLFEVSCYLTRRAQQAAVSPLLLHVLDKHGLLAVCLKASCLQGGCCCVSGLQNSPGVLHHQLVGVRPQAASTLHTAAEHTAGQWCMSTAAVDCSVQLHQDICHWLEGACCSPTWLHDVMAEGMHAGGSSNHFQPQSTHTPAPPTSLSR